MVYDILAVAIGGAIGATARFGVVNMAYALWGKEFPWGVLLANTLGSLMLGFLSVLFLVKFDLPEPWRVGILVGVLGAFTTFSTFSLDTLLMFGQGHTLKAFTNISANIALCLVFVWAGVLLAKQV